MATTKQSISAIIYDKRGKVLSIGYNSYIKTHPLQAEHAKKVGLEEKVFLHAEVHAIVRCKDLSKAHRIFISRWNKSGNPMYAKPCPVCISAIKSAGIEVVEHT
jgi:tRNA(Arg) A34 adenosine deaminase TadA